MRHFDRGRLADIKEFERHTRAASDLNQLSQAIDESVRQFGFRNYALAHNVDLSRRVGNSLFLTTYPEAWIEEFVRCRLFVDDPIIVGCYNSVSGFTWDVLRNLSPRQITTLKKARAHGLVAGFAMPMRMMGEPDATFAVTRPDEYQLSREDVWTARMIGVVAFERGRALLGDAKMTFDPVALTGRQIDCITFIAQGKSDWEIASILGVKEDTVRGYVEEAKKRYGVSKRTPLVLRALRDGHLNLDAALFDPRDFARRAN